MKTSLIVPVFNEEHYIGPFLESILTQSLPIDEVIICDNCCTDKTISIVNSYSSRLPIKIVKESKKGIRHAVETAWRSASGELILRADADCLLPPFWVSRIIKHFQNDPHLDACGGVFYGHDGPILFCLLTPLASTLNSISLFISRGYRVIYGGNSAFKKSFLESVNGFVSDKALQEDILISSKLHAAGFRTRIFLDCWNSTSLRRFSNLKSVLLNYLSGFNPRLYREKSI